MSACRGGERSNLSGELELQSRWFAGEFGRDFCGTSGEKVKIIQFGIWNRAAGPDFVEAAVSIDGQAPQRGAIEIDPDIKDWERHGHSQNPDYESVVLHVFQRGSHERVFSRTASHARVVQVQLSPRETRGLLSHTLARAGRCAPVLAAKSLSEIRETLLEAALLRFQKKAASLRRTGEVHGENESLFQAVAMGMGYPNNQLPFRLLAQRLPLHRLTDAPECAEALLFGVSGFLPTPDLSRLPPQARAHVRKLWQHWWPHRACLQSLQIPASVWRLHGQRPANHPMRRLGALSVLVRHWRALRRMLSIGDWRRLSTLLCSMRHAFWNHHYTFSSQPTPRSLALIGEERVEELLANSLLPFSGNWEKLVSMRARERNRRSKTAAARLLANRPDARKLLSESVCQQGLIQLYEDFCRCDASDCVLCRFPEQTIEKGA
jgi:hypothetical protein